MKRAMGKRAMETPQYGQDRSRTNDMRAPTHMRWVAPAPPDRARSSGPRGKDQPFAAGMPPTTGLAYTNGPRC